MQTGNLVEAIGPDGSKVMVLVVDDGSGGGGIQGIPVTGSQDSKAAVAQLAAAKAAAAAGDVAVNTPKLEMEVDDGGEFEPILTNPTNNDLPKDLFDAM